MLAVQPKPDGLKLSMVTLSTSPGMAPSTNTGPLTGLIRSNGMLVTSATTESLVKWPLDESWHSNSRVVPGATRSTGVKLLSQSKWLWTL